MWEEGHGQDDRPDRAPQRLVYKSYDTWEGVADAIRRMVVRGAPAIGVAAAMGVARRRLTAPRPRTEEQLLKEIERAADGLRERPGPLP